MKVLHTIRGLLKSGGGPSYTVPALASAQGRNGADVTILLDEDKFDYDSPQCVNAIVHRSQLNSNLTSFLSGFDLVHDHGVWLPCNHRIAVASRRAGIPRVISPRGGLQEWIWKQRRWKKELGWQLYQKNDLMDAAAIIATADIESDRVRQLGFSKNIPIIPNGVDVPGRIQKRKSEKRTALFMSRIHPKKGIEELIDAWIEVSPRDWTLLLAGPDEIGLASHLLNKVIRCGKELDVQWLGTLEGENKIEAFNRSELFILPTHSENFGVSIIEAMLMGLPVVTTDQTPWIDLERNGHGWIIPPITRCLVEILGKALYAPSLDLSNMGDSARQWASGRFSWDRIGKDSLTEYEKIYQEFK